MKPDDPSSKQPQREIAGELERGLSRKVTHAELERGLDHLRQAAAREPDLGLDVEGVLARIESEVTRGDTSSAFIDVPKHRWQPWAAVGAVAVAAAVSLFIATRPLTSPNTALQGASLPARGELDRGASGELGKHASLDGTELTLRQLIVAKEHDVTVRHPRMATWRLLAGGRARIVENGPERITLALESGLIQADVVPKEKHESFAIEVEHTRVAVHGTVFSVERQGDIAEVVVREGKVIVGDDSQRGDTQGTLLTAPSRASLEVLQHSDIDSERDAARAGKASERHGHQNAPGASPGTSPGTTAGTSSASLTPATPARPDPQELDRAWTSIAAEVSSCFAEHTARTPSVRVSFKTSLSVTLSSLGTVVDVDFTPPVPSAVRDCTLAHMSRVTTQATRLGAVVSRPILLTR